MNEVTRVPITDVSPDPKQPRTYFKEAALRALATSIKKTGQRQPITVRKRRAGAKTPYEIIDGERRWRACQLAGLDTIRIDVEDGDFTKHASQHLLSLASNFMREGHTHMEISRAVQYQVDAAVEAGQTRGQAVQSLVEALGKSEAWVYQYLQLQDLCPELQERLAPETPDNRRLRFNEAVVLANLPEAKQKAIYRAIMKANPAGRLEMARKLAAEATGQPRERRQSNIKVSTARFIAKISAEVERMLDYKQSEFRKALAQIPGAELKGFRASLAMLLSEVDEAGKAVRRG